MRLFNLTKMKKHIAAEKCDMHYEILSYSRTLLCYVQYTNLCCTLNIAWAIAVTFYIYF